MITCELMKSTKVLFWLRTDSTKKYYFTRSERHRIPEGWWKRQTSQYLKTKFLLFDEGNLFLIESAHTMISEGEYFHKTKMVPTYMYLYHFTQITVKIQPVFKLLAIASHNSEEGDCSHPIDASSAWLDSANCTNSPHKMTFLYRYPLRTLFEVLKNPFRRSNLHKTENYQGFFDLNPAKYRSFRDFVDRWKDFRRRQADGDDHWPVTVTSKNVFPRCRLA